MMKTQNREFMDVITELAERFHLEIPASFNKTGPKGLKDLMIKACTKAAEFYNLRLLKDADAEPVRKYLANRGITKDIIEEFKLGLAPKTYTTFYDKFKDELSDEVLEKSGLIISGKSGFIDRFRNRVIVPIQNEFGDVVAFGARAVEDDQQPKYLNSSDSIIYNKSKLLYGLYTAKDTIKAEDSVILMEGYFDVISAQTHGIKNCVASCGTSLTADHVKLLSRYTPSRRIYLSFDTDSAGLKATDRNADLIKEAFQGLGNIKQFDESYISAADDKYSCEIRVIAPPEGKDPDEFIRQSGAQSYRQYMEHAPLLIDFQLNNILKEKDETATPTEKTKFIKRIIPILQEIQNEIVQAEYVNMVANTIGVDETALLNEIRKMKEETVSQTGHNINRIVTKNSSISEKTQKNLLSVFFVTDAPLTFAQISEKISSVTFTDQMLINVKNTLEKLVNTVNNGKVKELIEQLYTKYVQEPEIQKLITELTSIAEAFHNLDTGDFEAVIGESISRINQCQKEEEQDRIRNLYKNVNNDDAQALKIQMQLRDRINNKFKLEKN
jgi:DNA primase